MSDATQVAEQEIDQQSQVDNEDEQLDAELDAGFSGEPTETPAQEKKEDEEQPEEVKEEPPKVRQITETEWDELNAKAKELDAIRSEQRQTADKVFGKIGGIERVLKDLQAKTPQGLAVDVTEDDVSDLRAEFPEIGDGVFKALQSFAGKLKGTAVTAASVDPEEVGKAVRAETRRLQEEALAEEYPDWQKITAPETEYRKWLSQQPEEYQQRLNSTESATVVARSIRRFQDDLAAMKVKADAKAAADAKAKAVQNTASMRKQRLAEATTERGTVSREGSKTDEDAFEEGFNS